jgi:hypothetical protein
LCSVIKLGRPVQRVVIGKLHPSGNSSLCLAVVSEGNGRYVGLEDRQEW